MDESTLSVFLKNSNRGDVLKGRDRGTHPVGGSRAAMLAK